MDPHEELARLRKAVRLADALDAMGYTDKTIEYIAPAQLTVASRVAGIHTASPDTMTLVINLLTDRRLVKATLIKPGLAQR